jgi:hypothetical protein
LGRRDPCESQFDLSLGTHLSSLKTENAAKSSVGVVALPCASVCKHWQEEKKPLTFEAMFSNEDTHRTHSYQSFSREEITIVHLQIPTVYNIVLCTISEV